MLRIGFVQKWVKWVMLYVTTVSYNISVNGDQVGPLNPSRGLRQGDPLSNYLFLLCAEGLSSLIIQVESRGKIHGCKVSRGAPSITHDLLSCVTTNETSVMHDLLSRYDTKSGQAINCEKSGIFFIPNITQSERHRISHILGVSTPPNTGHYLGLPFLIGKNKRQVFGFLRTD